MTENFSYGVRSPNALAVFTALSDGEGHTRSDIASRTGLSLMTVGKVADALFCAGIVGQCKQSTDEVGRKPRIIMLTRRCCVMLVTLNTVGEAEEMSGSAISFTADVLAPSGKSLHNYTYVCNNELTADENYAAFLGDIHGRGGNNELIVGAGIISSVSCDSKSGVMHTRLGDIGVLHGYESRFGVCPEIFDALSCAAVRADDDFCGGIKPDERTVLYISLAAALRCTAVINGRVTRLGRLEDFISENGKTLGGLYLEHIRAHGTRGSGFEDILYRAVLNIRTALLPDAVYLYGNGEAESALARSIARRVGERFGETCVVTLYEGEPPETREISRRLFSSWLGDIVGV
ncbi:MAG: hypothetical protein WCQ72_02525 [Eubacteriales bacterium]